MFERTDLFEAGIGGYFTYRIPGIVATPGGSLIAWCEARREGHLDWVDIDIVTRRSDDGGRTWSAAVKVLDSADLPVHNCVMISDPENGLIHRLHCLNYSRCFYSRSTDDGRSFSKPVEISHVFSRFSDEYDWNVLATGPGHAIRLKNGRLVVPVWLSTGGRNHRPSRISTIYSDDQGQTWERGELVPDTVRNMNETAVVELRDGSVLLNIRNEAPEHRRAVSVSRDGATGWSTPKFDDHLKEPICMASILRLPETKDGRDRILFSNPDSLELSRVPELAKQGRIERAKVSVKISYDDGATWPVTKVIEPDLSGYSDLAAALRGIVHLFFERGGVDGNIFVTRYLSLASFDLEWLEAH
jgi:sialidase-1